MYRIPRWSSGCLFVCLFACLFVCLSSVFFLFVFVLLLLFCFVLFCMILILPGCSCRCYHLFSHEGQDRNVPNTLTVGIGFHCLCPQCYIRGTQRKARDIVIHNNICSSELARMCGMSYIFQLGLFKISIWQPETQFCKGF